jgi:hypothetical protein
MGGSFLVNYSELKGKNKELCADSTFCNENALGYFLGLSDGAGSKKYSHIGSFIVLYTAEEILINMLKAINCNPKKIDDNFKKEFIDRLQIQAAEEFNSNKIDDYAATLLFAFYIKQYDRWLVGHIGDGVIGGIDYNDNLYVVSTPENGEFSNETYFYSDKNAKEHLRLYWVRGLKGIVMFSDGPEVVLYDKKNKKLANAIKNLFKWQKELGDGFDEILSENLKLFAKYTQDDCSIILGQIEKGINKDVRYKKFAR